MIKILQTIKSYLISLGFRVDDPSLNKAQNAMDTMERAAGSFSKTTAGSFAIATAGVSTFFAVASAGVTKFIFDIAQADMNNQLFARRMWLNVDAARAYQSSLNALGVSLEDLYLSPELMSRFKSLQSQALQMQMPTEEYKESMMTIRDWAFEFKRLKLEATYSLQWIGYYLQKYIEPILKSSGLSLKDINNLIQRNMPVWTQKVALILSWFVRLGAAAWSAREGIAAIVAIFAGFKLISLGPLGLALAGILAILLLIDDYNTHKNHGESMFSGLWEDVDKFKKSIGENFKGNITDIWAIFKEIVKTVGKIFNTIDDIVKKITGKDSLTLALEGLQKSLETTRDIFGGILDVVTQIEGIIKIIGGYISGDKEEQEEGKKDLKKGSSGMFEFRDFIKEFKEMFTWREPFANFFGVSGKQTAFPAYAYRTNNISNTAKTNSDNKITNTSTYNIYGASDPTSTARTVDYHQKQTLIRYNQGVLL